MDTTTVPMSEYNNLKKMYDNISLKNLNLNNDIEQYKETIDKIINTNNIADMKNIVIKMKDGLINNLKTTNEKLNNDNMDFHESIKEMKNDMKKMKDDITHIQIKHGAQIAGLESDVNDLKIDNTVLHSLINDQNGIINDQNTRINHLENRVDSLEQSFEFPLAISQTAFTLEKMISKYVIGKSCSIEYTDEIISDNFSDEKNRLKDKLQEILQDIHYGELIDTINHLKKIRIPSAHPINYSREKLLEILENTESVDEVHKDNIKKIIDLIHNGLDYRIKF